MKKTYSLSELNRVVWTQDNQGSGSGLDADKLDGLDSTDFVKKTDTLDSVSDVIYSSLVHNSILVYDNEDLVWRPTDPDNVTFGNAENLNGIPGDKYARTDIIETFAENVVFEKSIHIFKDVIIDGNFTVNGSSSVTNVTNMEIEDNMFVLNRGEQGAGISAGKAGFSIDRGSLPEASLYFDESDDKWKINDGQTVYNIAIANSDGLVENADTLDGIDSSQFLRSDVEDVYEPKFLKLSHDNATITFGPIISFDSRGKYRVGIGTQDYNFGLLSSSYYYTEFRYSTQGDGATAILSKVGAQDGVLEFRAATQAPSENTHISWSAILQIDSSQGIHGLRYNGFEVWHSGNQGPNSGLNADLLDGRDGNSFVYVEDYEDIDVLNKIKNVDGTGSGLDADLIDGLDSSQLARTDVDEIFEQNVQINKNLHVLQDTTIDGDLTVKGSMTTIETTNLEITDNEIVLNKGETGTGVSAGEAGVAVDRGSEPVTKIYFDESDDRWKLLINNNVYFIPLSTQSTNAGDADTLDGHDSTEFILKADVKKLLGDIENPLLRLPLKNSLSPVYGNGTAHFFRSSPATYIDTYGYLRNVGNDEPRFEKNGLLIEGASTNLSLYSEDINHWNAVKTSKTIDSSVPNPYGTDGAPKITGDGNSGEHYVERIDSISSSSDTYTVSLFVKKGDQDTVAVRAYLTGGTQVSAGTLITFSTESVTGGAKLQKLRNGWYRVSFQITDNNSGNNQIRWRCYVDNGSSSSTTTGYTYCFGGQIEKLPFMTSYIKTTFSTSSRSAELAYIDSYANIPEFDQPITIVVDWDSFGHTYNSDKYILGGGASSRFILGYGWGLDFYAFRTGKGAILGTNVNPEITGRITYTNDLSEGKLYHEGDLILTSTANGSPHTLNGVIGLGCRGDSGVGHLWGHISNVRIYDTVFTEEQVKFL